MASRKPTDSSAQGTGEQSQRTTRLSKSQTKESKEAQAETPNRSTSNKAKQVTVTFNITVPEMTAAQKRSVYLTGTFSQGGSKSDWDAASNKMKKVDDTHYTIAIKLPEDAVIEYKYTLGDWDHVELDQHCQDTSNRQLSVMKGSTQTVNDSVWRWRGIEPCR